VSNEQKKGLTAHTSRRDFIGRVHGGPWLESKRSCTGLGHRSGTDQRNCERQALVSADTALRLARYFGTTPELWMNLQSCYDLEMAKAIRNPGHIGTKSAYHHSHSVALSVEAHSATRPPSPRR